MHSGPGTLNQDTRAVVRRMRPPSYKSVIISHVDKSKGEATLTIIGLLDVHAVLAQRQAQVVHGEHYPVPILLDQSYFHT
jgi:hypothetical protein